MIHQRSKLLVIILLTIVVFSSCSKSYKVLFKENTNNYALLKKDILDKLKKNNPQNPDIIDDNFDIFINPIILKKKNIGVYNYGIIGSHHSKTNFFTYDKNSIHLIIKLEKENIITEIENFMTTHKFTKDQQKKCLEIIVKLLNDNSSDSF